MNKIKILISRCKESDSSIYLVLFYYIFYKLFGKNIIMCSKVIFKGLKNIETNDILQIGMKQVPLMHKKDITFFNIQGKFICIGSVSIGKGCRFYVGERANLIMGRTFINSNTNFIIENGMTIGNDGLISWGCEFLDTDFHELSYEGKKEKNPIISIGDRVWIGSNVKVLKGTRVPNNCVIAAGSIVSSIFEEENCLIAGNPAKIIKRGISWK